jgi:hypothetical protein
MKLPRPSLRSSHKILTAVLLLAACAAAPAQQATAPYCQLNFTLELTPDVPNVRDPAFVGSLLGDHGGFRLYLQHVIDDTHLGMSILGPGMRRDCRQVLDDIRKDARVKSIEVQQ